MNWKSITHIGWKILAVLSIPLVILAVILIISSSSGTKSVPTEQHGEPPTRQLASNLWPDAQIPYTIEPYIMEDSKVTIKSAMKVFQDMTCVKFEEKKQSDGKWLSFVRNDNLCLDASLGMNISEKGEGKIQFGLDCLTVPNIQRLIGRTLGLEFEETRPDRDKFIVIVSNCKENPTQTQENITAISNGHNPAALEIFFDYTSRMFSGVNCLRALGPGGIKFGPNDTDTDSKKISLLDAEKINAIYDCPGCKSYRFRPVNRVTESAYSFESYHPVRAGNDLDGVALYICRIYHRGSILIGKMKVTHEENLCWVSDGGMEYRYGKKYEVLTNPRNANLTWTEQVGTTIPPNAIPGGRSVDRQTLFIGRCPIQSYGKITIIPSSVFPGTNSLKVPFAHLAQHCSSFEILVCNE